MSTAKADLNKKTGDSIFERIKEKLFGTNFLLFVTILLFVFMYIAGLIAYKDKNFGNLQVFLNLIISNAGLIIVSVGMTMVPSLWIDFL